MSTRVGLETQTLLLCGPYKVALPVFEPSRACPQKRNLFKDFSEVAEYTGTYTAGDYLDILEHLMKKWKVSSRTGAAHLRPPLPSHPSSDADTGVQCDRCPVCRCLIEL